MSFGKTGHAYPKAAAIRMRARFVESPNELHQIARVLERIAGFVIAASARRVATQRKNICDARLCVPQQDRLDLVFLMANASQVRDRVEVCGGLNTLNPGLSGLEC